MLTEECDIKESSICCGKLEEYLRWSDFGKRSIVKSNSCDLIDTEFEGLRNSI